MSEWRLTTLRGEFCVTWQDGNVRRRYRLGTSDPKEAARRAPARYAELTRPRGTTVKDLWEGYVADMEGRAVVGTMKWTWRALEGRFAPIDGDAVTIADCRAHIAERRADGIKDGTIHTELGHLRMVLLWAEKHRLIDRAPAIERPSKPEPKDAYLTRGEVGRMLDAAKVPHIRLAILLLIGTGARVSAALELAWDRVDFERGMIRLRNPFDRARRKGRAVVPMNDELRAALQETHKASLSPFVIEWAGGPVKSIKRGLKVAGKAVGRPDTSPHMFRHSAAVWMVEDGHSFEEVAQFLGHDDVNVTRKTYARYSPTHLRKLASSLTVRGGAKVT
jgi:integrase